MSTASTTGLTDARYQVVGPTVGDATLLIWLAAVSLLPALRRVPVLMHLLGAALWLFCGVMLLLVTGTKQHRRPAGRITRNCTGPGGR